MNSIIQQLNKHIKENKFWVLWSYGHDAWFEFILRISKERQDGQNLLFCYDIGHFKGFDVIFYVNYWFGRRVFSSLVDSKLCYKV